MQHVYYTYFISDGELIKIGKTKKSILSRLSTLQIGSSQKLTLIGLIPGDYESTFHERFHAYRVRGEWFRLSVVDLQKIMAGGSSFYLWLVQQIGNCTPVHLDIKSRVDWISDLATDVIADPSFPRDNNDYRHIKQYVASEKFSAHLTAQHYGRWIPQHDVLYTLALAFRNWKRTQAK